MYYCIFSGLLTMLGAVDCYFMKHAYIITLVKGASAQLVFGFEVRLQFCDPNLVTRPRYWYQKPWPLPRSNKFSFKVYANLLKGCVLVFYVFILFCPHQGHCSTTKIIFTCIFLYSVS